MNLIKCPQVIQLQLSRVYSSSEYESLWVEACHGPAVQVHESLAVWGTEIPESDGTVQGPGEE